VYPLANYRTYIEELPKEVGGRFSEGPLFLLVLYTGLGVVFVMSVFFVFYVTYKRSVLRKRVLRAFSAKHSAFQLNEENDRQDRDGELSAAEHGKAIEVYPNIGMAKTQSQDNHVQTSDNYHDQPRKQNQTVPVT